MDLTSMDPPTAKLAIQLQLEDILESLDSLYHDRELAQGDELASLQTFRGDLTQQLALLEGQLLLISILTDDLNERKALKQFLDDEKQAASDHQLALKLAGTSKGAADATFSEEYKTQLDEANECDNDTQWEMAKQLYAFAFDDDEIHSALEGGPVQPAVANYVSVHSDRISPAEQTPHEVLESKDLTKCNACIELVPTKTTLLLQCDHTYCYTCLLDLFKSAISNPDLFPPRCCRVPVPLESYRVLLPQELIKDFDLKVDELATPNPTHCVNTDCAKFIRPKNIKDDVGTCVFCMEATCVRCKNLSHPGLCPSDPHVQLLMDVAKRSKWQQCTKCNNLVELAQGCFHMRQAQQPADRSQLTPTAADASISSATSVAHSGRAALALSGTNTISPVRSQE